MKAEERRKLYRTKRWKRLRLQVLDAHNWRCAACGRAGRLEVHHRRSTADGGAMWDPANLEPICRPCHFDRHRAQREAQRLGSMSSDRRAWWEHIRHAAA